MLENRASKEILDGKRNETNEKFRILNKKEVSEICDLYRGWVSYQCSNI